MTHLFMKLDETLCIIGQADALRRVKALPGVFNVKAHGEGYKIDLEKPTYALSVTKRARDVNCVHYIHPCRHLMAV